MPGLFQMALALNKCGTLSSVSLSFSQAASSERSEMVPSAACWNR